MLIKRGNSDTDTHRENSMRGHEEEGRDQGDVSGAKEYKGWLAKHKKLGERHRTDFPSQPHKEPTQPTP